MQFDLVTLLGFGVLAAAAIFLHRRRRSDTVVAEDDLAVGQRQDVLRAIKSMRKD